MFDFVIIACIVFRVDGTPTNACYPFGSNQHYQTEAECMAGVKLEMDKISGMARQDFPTAVTVSTGACRQISEQL